MSWQDKKLHIDKALKGLTGALRAARAPASEQEVAAISPRR